MMPFYAYPVQRLEEISSSLSTSLRTLPDPQLRAERESLRAACQGSIGTRPEALLLALYDGELARRRDGWRP